MKPFLVLSLLGCVLSATGGRGQAAKAPIVHANEAQPSSSPAETVTQSFVKLDTLGARLTPESRRSAATLFESPDTDRSTLLVSVIGSHYGFSKLSQDAHDARFYFGYEVLGKLDDSLRFTPSRSAVEIRSFKKFRVVVGKKNSNSETIEWRIVGSQPRGSFITPEAAIRYVTQMRDRTTDGTLKHNADKTIASLKRYPH